MNLALRDDPVALRVNLTAPTTAVRLGPFSFDGLKALVGMDLTDARSPLMIGPKYQRPAPPEWWTCTRWRSRGRGSPSR